MIIQEVEQYKQLLEKDKTVEIRDVWRNELKKCIAEIQREYDDKLGHIKAEYETKMETQVIMTGSVSALSSFYSSEGFIISWGGVGSYDLLFIL